MKITLNLEFQTLNIVIFFKLREIVISLHTLKVGLFFRQKEKDHLCKLRNAGAKLRMRSHKPPNIWVYLKECSAEESEHRRLEAALFRSLLTDQPLGS